MMKNFENCEKFFPVVVTTTIYILSVFRKFINVIIKYISTGGLTDYCLNYSGFSSEILWTQY